MAIEEKNLILPALYIVKRDGKATMSDLVRELSIVFNPTGEDAKILSGRNDTKFSQKVRNLKSHRENNGMAEYTFLEKSEYRLTPKGEEYLASRLSELNYLFSQKFEYDDVKTLTTHICNKKAKIIVVKEDELISEGELTTVSSKTRNRSKKLREAAIEHYTVAGKIKCEVCGFCFEDKYGDLGKNFIEIHHEKPVCHYSETGIEKFIKDAVVDVKPLCANCHRMIHRNPKKPLSIDELKALTK